MKVGVIDYGIGNLGSLVNMFYRLAIECTPVSDPADLEQYDHVILPGVGAYDTAVEVLHASGFDASIRRYAQSGRQLLGICLGMQLLLDSSEEGNLPGLGLIPGRAVKFRADVNVRVPHMGWNSVRPTRSHSLFTSLDDENRFYFAHSYHASGVLPANTLATTHHGSEFASMIFDENVAGAQFHPEKSHRFGLALLNDWVAA